MTWATSVPILVFLGLSVLELGPMYAIDRQTSERQKASLNASALWRQRHNKMQFGHEVSLVGNQKYTVNLLLK